jgi:SAM-dependent methyltransferase
MSEAASSPDPTRAARLEHGARIAAALAPLLCRTPSGARSASGVDDCGALHGIWPLLRRLGLAAEPARHDAFYRAELAGLARTGTAARVLVSGTADWGMLELIAEVYRAAGARLEPTVVDRCPTPIMLNAWFGSATDLPVRVVTADVIHYAGPGPFDVICTHSLLGYPEDGERRALVANWRRLLRPGGAVVTVTRLSQPSAARLDEAAVRRRAEAFGDATVARAHELGFAHDAAGLRAAAERFSRAQVHHPVGDAAALRRLFEEQGFCITVLQEHAIGPATGTAEWIVGAARGGTYGEIVAVNP